MAWFLRTNNYENATKSLSYLIFQYPNNKWERHINLEYREIVPCWWQFASATFRIQIVCAIFLVFWILLSLSWRFDTQANLRKPLIGTSFHLYRPLLLFLLLQKFYKGFGLSEGGLRWMKRRIWWRPTASLPSVSLVCSGINLYKIHWILLRRFGAVYFARSWGGLECKKGRAAFAPVDHCPQLSALCLCLLSRKKKKVQLEKGRAICRRK